MARLHHNQVASGLKVDGARDVDGAFLACGNLLVAHVEDAAVGEGVLAHAHIHISIVVGWSAQGHAAQEFLTFDHIVGQVDRDSIQVDVACLAHGDNYGVEVVVGIVGDAAIVGSIAHHNTVSAWVNGQLAVEGEHLCLAALHCGIALLIDITLAWVVNIDQVENCSHIAGAAVVA